MGGEAINRKEEAMAQPVQAQQADLTAIQDLFYRAAEMLEEGRFLEWVDLFAEDGVYTAITAANLKDRGLAIFTDRGRAGLRERAAYWMGMWQVNRGSTSHVIGNVRLVGRDGDQIQVRSKFIMTRMNRDGLVDLHTAGSYQDVLTERGGALLFQHRRVIIDNRTLPSNFTDPL